MTEGEPLDIATRRAAFIKARAVLDELERTNNLDRAKRDGPALFANRDDVALTEAETALIEDALNGTRNSRFAFPPEGYPDRLPDLCNLGRE
jgi:hypothetical protein